MSSEEVNNSNSSNDIQSCNPQMSRAEFLAQLRNKAIIGGTLAAGIIIADSFIAPPRTAAASGGKIVGMVGPGAVFADTIAGNFGPGAAFADPG